MHCLPSIRSRQTARDARVYEQLGLDGAEVTEEVFESKRSIVFEQAVNRMHASKALLIQSLAS
jgi:ornithine carbamoyltransferase